MAPSVVVDADAVGLSYGELVGVAPATFSLRHDERVAIIGPSGAGKSSLLKLIVGLVRPTQGSLTVLGSRRQTTAEQQNVGARIGYLPQNLGLVDELRVIHNVNSGLLGRWKPSQALLSLARPANRDRAVAALAEHGIEHLVDVETGTLSGGERQRVALARLSVQHAELIVADEPLTGLDPQRSIEALEALNRQAAKTHAPLIASLHDPDLARSAFDRIWALREGRLIIDRAASQVSNQDIAELYAISPTTARP